MKKLLLCSFMVLAFSSTALAADTTFSTRNQPKQKKTKPTKAPVNLYTQPSPQSMQNLSGQQFVPQINFQPGTSSGIQVNTPYYTPQNTQPVVEPPQQVQMPTPYQNPYEDNSKPVYVFE